MVEAENENKKSRDWAGEYACVMIGVVVWAGK